MRKLATFLIVFAITSFTSNLFAQGAYLNINAGYGFSMASQALLANSTRSTTDNYQTGDYSSYGTDEVVNVSFGKGFNFGGAFGYMFNEHVGAELGVSYLLGGKSEGKYESTHTTIEYEGVTTTSSSTDIMTVSSKMLRFIPSIVIAAGLEGVDPYAKFGVIIGMGSITTEEEDTSPGDVIIEKWEHGGGIALGLNAALGINIPMSDKAVFFIEINMVNMSYAPKNGELTELTYNGIDELPNLTTRDKEIEYVDTYSYNSNSPPLDSQADQELKRKFPFGSVGANVGVKINL